MRVTIRKLWHEGLRLRSTMRKYDPGFAFVVRRFWRLYLRDLYSPNEIFQLGLLDPGIDDGLLRKFVSKERMLRLQCRLNPSSHVYLTENKIAFHKHCRAKGLTTPEVFAVYSPKGGGDPRLPLLQDRDAWMHFHRERVIQRLILKPVNGVHGRGVFRLTRVDQTAPCFEDQTGKRCDSDGLLTLMQATGYEDWLVQECLDAHPLVSALTGSNALQTARVVTFVDERGQSSILATRLRLIVGSSPFDNFVLGAAGNLVARVQPESGALEVVLGADSDGLGTVIVPEHPTTRASFSNFRVPDWQAVRDLAIRAANAFRPLRTIGWDIAVTPDGPMLLEGNVTWDPPTGDPRSSEIYQLMRSNPAQTSREV